MKNIDITKAQQIEGLRGLLAQSENKRRGSGPVPDDQACYYHRLFHDIPTPVFLLDRRGIVQDVNPAGLKLLGCGAEAIHQANFTTLFKDSTDKEYFLRDIRQAKAVRALECWIRTEGCRELNVIVNASVRRDAAGKETGYHLFLQDMTELKHSDRLRKQAMDKLEKTVGQLEDVIAHDHQMAVDAEVMSAELSIAFNASSDGLCVVGNDKKVIRINDKFALMAGVDKLEAEGRLCHDLFCTALCRGEHCLLEHVRKTGQLMEREVKYERPGVGIRTYIVAGNPLVGFGGEVLGVVESYKDITERKRMERELRRLATIDELTGARNRTYFWESAQKDLSRVHRYGFPMSIICFDLDHFKRINDAFGHAAGDNVLRQVGRLARQQLRDSDMLGRLGGEEFAVLLVESNLKQAEIAAQRLRRTFETAGVQFGEQEIKYTASFGVAELDMSEDLEHFISRADQALYRAKNSGRNLVHLASPAGSRDSS
jgi:diguanylate cyclase (GGDEF)-like protein/PAS domain S-box-containing protein